MVASTRSRHPDGFTLLELLAAVALLVMLGTLLFEVFGQAARVMRIGQGRHEVYQYARALFETLEREIPGCIGVRDAGPNRRGMPFVVGTSSSAATAFKTEYSVDVREGSDTLSLTAALLGRDTVADSPTRGQTANVAVVAYWLTPDDFVLNRYESYDVDQPRSGRGWEFAMNVLEFRIEVLDPFTSTPAFEHKDWDSRDTVSGGVKRGLPGAIQVIMKVTDADHIDLWQFDPVGKCSALKPGVRAEDDKVVQEFRHVLRTAEKQ